MKKQQTIPLLAALSVVLSGGCVVDDEPSPEESEVEVDSLDDLPYAAGHCGVIAWSMGLQRWTQVDSLEDCHQEAWYFGDEYCRGLRAGARGPNPLWLEYRFFNWDQVAG